MSYQEIYRGLNKKASDEQLKKLAGMIKQAKLNKEAGSWLTTALKTGFNSSKDFGKKVLFTTGKAFRDHPIAMTGTTALTLGGIPTASYFMGRSSLSEPLAKANETVKKLTEQKKALEDQSGWAKLWEDLKKWWAKLWESKQEAPKAAGK